MEFKSKFEVGDIVYFYSNERTYMFNYDEFLPSHVMFILEGEIIRIIVDYMDRNTKIKQPFITYKVRIGDTIVEDVHEDFLAISIDELAEQSKEYFISKLINHGKK